MTDQRALAQRQHRLLAMHLALCCWVSKKDAVILERGTFTKYLSLERVRRARIKQFEEDASAWFPFKTAFFLSGKEDSLSSIILSRIPIPTEVSSGSKSMNQRVIDAARIGFALAPSKDLSHRYPEINEEDVVAELAVWAAGLSAPLPVDAPVK
mgnify:CR=1 FL=1